MGKCSSPLSQAGKWSTRKAEKSVVQSQNESLLPWLKTLSHQFPVFSSCESTLHLNPTFLKFTTWTRKLISSTLASHKCCGHNLEMESSVTHGKNSLSSSANRENISFVVIIAKFQCAVFSRVGLWEDLPDVLMSAGDASGFPRISSHSSRWENFCSWQAWRILLIKWDWKTKQT